MSQHKPMDVFWTHFNGDGAVELPPVWQEVVRFDFFRDLVQRLLEAWLAPAPQPEAANLWLAAALLELRQQAQAGRAQHRAYGGDCSAGGSARHRSRIPASLRSPVDGAAPLTISPACSAPRPASARWRSSSSAAWSRPRVCCAPPASRSAGWRANWAWRLLRVQPAVQAADGRQSEPLPARPAGLSRDIACGYAASSRQVVPACSPLTESAALSVRFRSAHAGTVRAGLQPASGRCA
jgi:hypothetical protein